MLVLIIFWVIIGIAVAIVANSKGRDPLIWFVYGAFVWPVALAHILVSVPSDRKPCPVCAELTKIQAKVCPHCGNELPSDFGPKINQKKKKNTQFEGYRQSFTIEQIRELKAKNLARIDFDSIREFSAKHECDAGDVVTTVQYYHMRGWPPT